MKYWGTISSLFILVMACGDDGSMTQTSVSAPTTNPSTTNQPPTSATESDASASATDSTGSTPTTGTTSAEGAPMFLSFGANVATLTQDESVTFNAVLTDPDGVADIVGGTLLSGDESLEFGVFQAAGQPGAYSLSLSWAQIHQTEPIEFDGGQNPREFRAVFFDQGGHKAIEDVSLDLVCAGGAACGGTCTDLAVDGGNCGACGHACDGGESACEAGTCAPALSRCVKFDEGLETCTAICQSTGESCVEMGCLQNSTALFFDSVADCEGSSGPGYSPMPCGELHEWTPNAMAIQCCCTDT